MPYNQKINQEINPYQKYYTPLWAIRVLFEYWSKYDKIQGNSQRIISIPKSRIPDFQRKAA